MTVELHVNGKLVIELRPESLVERAILQEMASRAELGRPVRLAMKDNENAYSYTVSIEKS